MCTRSSVPPFKELSKFFQVKGQINGKEYSDKSPTTMNQLLVNVYDAVTHMEHMQQRFIPIGAAIIMNNWITLANPSDVIIALNRLRHVSFNSEILTFQFSSSLASLSTTLLVLKSTEIALNSTSQKLLAIFPKLVNKNLIQMLV
jgi:hypothetical protein